jgi:hypothetical protein
MADERPEPEEQPEHPMLREIKRWQATAGGQLAQVSSQLGPIVEQLREAQAKFVGGEYARQVHRLSKAVHVLPEITELLERLQEVSAAVRIELREAMPDNWEEVEGLPLVDLVDLVLRDGIAVVWVPRAEIVHELLLASTDAERDAILVARESDILDDLDVVLANIGEPTVAASARAAAEAISTARGGHHMAAQTLVASTVTHIVQRDLGHPRFDIARTKLREDDPEEIALTLLRRTLVYHCLANAIEHTKHARVGFNRNATAGHEGMFEQCTPANCLRSLLLLVGLLRESCTGPAL